MVQMAYLKKLGTIITNKICELNTTGGVRETGLIITKGLEIMTVGSQKQQPE